MVLPISVFLSPLLPSQPIEPITSIMVPLMIFVMVFNPIELIVFIMIFVTVEVEEEGWCARPVV